MSSNKSRSDVPIIEPGMDTEPRENLENWLAAIGDAARSYCSKRSPLGALHLACADEVWNALHPPRSRWGTHPTANPSAACSPNRSRNWGSPSCPSCQRTAIPRLRGRGSDTASCAPKEHWTNQPKSHHLPNYWPSSPDVERHHRSYVRASRRANGKRPGNFSSAS